ncbi:unnamed protein product [Brachionus calyciflorus]|uniref:SWIM-type domain-containing protein n=1 Tax=Brachionus calyciflorus TaxID=104777 RepID=A0A813ZDP9_9BILA|nr:unnamed protein product [Brachionus calyciflorus]
MIIKKADFLLVLEVFFCCISGTDGPNWLNFGYVTEPQKSRHSSTGIYNVFLEFTNNKLEMKPIKGWYCTCKNRARVVGTCAHVTSVIWFLGYARENPEVLKPTSSDTYSQFCFDSAKYLPDDPTNISDDEEIE